MRLIDADKLKKYPIRINHYDKEHGNLDFVLGVESVMEYAETLPAVDAVEVVRCKDCKFHDKDGNCDGGMFYACVSFTEDGIMRTEDNDFCSYGERKQCSMGQLVLNKLKEENK